MRKRKKRPSFDLREHDVLGYVPLRKDEIEEESMTGFSSWGPDYTSAAANVRIAQVCISNCIFEGEGKREETKDEQKDGSKDC